MYEIKCVCFVERPMLKFTQGLQVRRFVVQHKLMRVVVHFGQQFTAFVYDRHPLTPGEHRRKKTCDLDVLFFLIRMGDNDRIGRNEPRLIVTIYLVIEKCLEVCGFRTADELKAKRYQEFDDANITL